MLTPNQRLAATLATRNGKGMLPSAHAVLNAHISTLLSLGVVQHAPNPTKWKAYSLTPYGKSLGL